MITKNNSKKSIENKPKKKINKNTAFKTQYFAYYNDVKTTPKQDW